MSNNEYELVSYIKERAIEAEHLSFSQSCHSVEEAAQVVGGTIDQFIKSIALIDEQDRLIIAIVSGTDRASTKRVGRVLEIERPRLATADEILERTGYPCGGTPPFGYPAIFVIDENVMDKEYIYAGGGSTCSLIQTTPSELLKANQGTIARIRK